MVTEVPRPKDVVRCVEQFRPSSYARKLERAAGGPEALRAIVAEFDPRVVVQRPLEDVAHLLQARGRIRTMFDRPDPRVEIIGTHSGATYVDARLAKELLLDIHGAGGDTGTTVYGRIASGVPTGFGKPHHELARLYGHGFMTMFSRVSERITVTAGDSLNVGTPNAVAGWEQLGLVLAKFADGGEVRGEAGARAQVASAFRNLDEAGIWAYAEVQGRALRLDDVERIDVAPISHYFTAGPARYDELVADIEPSARRAGVPLKVWEA